MDIHRCRFVPYPVSAVNAVAFSHTSLVKSTKTAPVRLAIGRANGDIEIWNPLFGSWYQEVIIRGGKGRNVEALVWIAAPDEEQPNGKTIHGRCRLFSIGYSATVTEWDLEKARAKTHASGQHGELWCLAAQPRGGKSSDVQRVVGGTADGCLALYSVDDDDLQFQGLIRTTTKKVKMVCIAFQSRNIAVVGCSDSAIRIFNLQSRSVTKTMTLGQDLTGGARNVIVWSVKCLSNGDIVSGDSTGQICMWDGTTYTQTQRIQGHTQDVLSLATNADATAIFSGGMDKKTVQYRKMPGKASRWAKVWHRRYHSHDVKTMASFEAPGLSVVVSGGPDASPVVMPLLKSGANYHRTLSHLPQPVPLCSAPQARIVVSWWEREVRIWKLHRPPEEVLGTDAFRFKVDANQNRRQLGRILFRGDSNISSAAISHDGSLLVVATVSEIKAFRLVLPQKAGGKLQILPVGLPKPWASQGATNIAVSPDGLWVCAVQGIGGITIAKVDRTGARLSVKSNPASLDRLRRDVPKHLVLGGLGSYDRQVTHVAFSPDSKLLALADLAGYIDTWVLRPAGHEAPGANAVEDNDAFSSSSSSEDESPEKESLAEPVEGWIRNPKARLIPKLPAAPVVLSLSGTAPGSRGRDKDSDHDGTDYVLLAITTSSDIFAFHPLLGKLAPWSDRIKRARLPIEYRRIRDLAKGVMWQGPRLWVYGASFLCMIDTSVEPEDGDTTIAAQRSAQGLKRKRGADAGAGGKIRTGQLEAASVRVVMEGSGEGAGRTVDMDMDDVGDGQNSSAEDDDSDGSEPGQSGDEGDGVAGVTGKEPTQPRRWWCTHKYRPILGMVPLESHGVVDDDAEEGVEDKYPPLEVALVERPAWDLELPAQYAEDDGGDKKTRAGGDS